MKRWSVVAAGSVGVFLFVSGCGGGDDASSATPGVDGSVSPGADAGGGADTSAPPDDDATVSTCGNGTVEGAEECDQGAQNGAGKACGSDCFWTCIAGDPKRGDVVCDDGNPCTGKETCGASHTCIPGTPLGDGATCGTKKICNGGGCADAVCGDKILTPPEECDEGSANGTGGCDKSCRFTCVSTDPTRNCPADACLNAGACTDATHTCTPGTPKADGTTCTAGSAPGACKAGACVAAACGDGVVIPPEQCDFGANNGPGKGCEVNCTFSCTKTPESCVTVDACAGTNSCTTVTDNGHSGQKCVVGAPPAAGTACGTGGTCQGNVCVTAKCGNGTVDPGEQCDFGTANNGPGKGCESGCTFSCQKAPDTCPSNDRCSATPQACTAMTGPGGGAGQQCKAATPLAACAACGTGGVCSGGQCKTSVCGDSCVDPANGETCDPANGTTCSAKCHLCGDGKRQDDEQCDDGNNTNLDGCDSTCHFEQVHRANSASLQYATDAYCGADALGKAIQALAQGTITSSLSNGVKDGSTTIAFKFMGLKDLTGGAKETINLGAISGAPATAAGKTYDGTSDVDWWYTTTPSAIDASRNPISRLTTNLDSFNLNGTGSLDLVVTLAGQLASLHLTGAKIHAVIGSTPALLTAPKVSSDKLSPGHLPSENLDPALKSFETMSGGQLCGNISAASLATVPIPGALATGNTKCSEAYDPQSATLLDALVGGCNLGVLPLISATQPDQVDSSVPVAGAGPKYTLVATNKKVSGCTDKSGTKVDLAACLKAAAYSSYFKFTSDRVIAK